MPFQDKTRRKIIRLAQQAVAGAGTSPGGTFTWDIPKTGLLAGIYVHMYFDMGAAGCGAADAKGALADLVDRVRLIANSGIDLINISGAGLQLLRYYEEDMKVGTVTEIGTAAETAIVGGATGTMNFFLPVSINRRDPLGLFMLQNEATLLQLQITIPDAATACGAASVYDSLHLVPFLEIFTVPADPKDWPPLNVVHQLVEDQRAISAAGAFEYKWPRGNTYAQVLHGIDTGASTDFSDNFTAVNLTVNQSDVLYNYDPDILDMEFVQSHALARHAGHFAFDFLGSSGLGTFGSARDMLYSAMVTEISTNITASAAGTLYTVRRQLVALKG